MSNAPIVSLSAHGIQVSVWENESEGSTYLSAKIERRYKDKDGNWKSTEYLGGRDMLIAAQLLQAAWARVSIKARKSEEGKMVPDEDIPF